MPEDIPPPSRRQLVWATSVDVKELKRAGYSVWKYGDLRSQYIAPSRSVTEQRSSLSNAAAPLLELLDRSQRLAVIGVPAKTVGDIADIYGYLVEPAFRRDLSLLIQADRELGSLEADELIDPRMRYALDYERLKYLARRYLVRQRDGLPPLTPIEASLLRAMREESLTPPAQFGVGRYRADFAFPSHRLIVEADGRDWHDAQRDSVRDAHLAQLGWSTIHFTGSEIYRDARGVARQVAQALATRTSLSTMRLSKTVRAPGGSASSIDCSAKAGRPRERRLHPRGDLRARYHCGRPTLTVISGELSTRTKVWCK